MATTTAYVNSSPGITDWHTGPEAVQAYEYVPANSKIPTIGRTAEERDPLVHIKLFDPTGSWSWYLIEADRTTGEAFALVQGFELELGSVDLNELSAVRGRMGLPIERDIHFTPRRLSLVRLELR